ncbi:MAG: gamma-glutamyl-gamma-aminobutyrate hydrolase family protein [Cyclobacteriaceae bacterium]
MLKIGISACFMYPDPTRVVFGPKNLSYIENDMAGYVTQEGILPVLIPDVPAYRLEPILSEMHGFVFQGGTDLAPEMYGEQPIVAGKWLGDIYRDEYELKILDFAIKNKKPVFAICRGIQLLNVYFGGSLYQDIATQNPLAIKHRDADRYDSLSHQLLFEKGKILERIYSNKGMERVNSVHHQAIKNLGKGLEVLARCKEDGLIEAVGYQGALEGKVIGVQWHPEFSVNRGVPFLDPMILYQLFIDQVKLEIK